MSIIFFNIFKIFGCKAYTFNNKNIIKIILFFRRKNIWNKIKENVIIIDSFKHCISNHHLSIISIIKKKFRIRFQLKSTNKNDKYIFKFIY